MGFIFCHEFLIGTGLEIDGNVFSFPKQFRKGLAWNHSIPAGKHTVGIPFEKGVLTVSGNFSLVIQDNRIFKQNAAELRFIIPGVPSPVKNIEASLKMKFERYSVRGLDLSRAANSGYSDEVAGDRKGGWTDQGKAFDMRSLKPGEYRKDGISFRIPDTPKKCIIPFSKYTPAYPREIRLPANGASGKTLYLLHACAWLKHDKVIGFVDVLFQDGGRKTIPVTAGRDVMNWIEPETALNSIYFIRIEEVKGNTGMNLSRFEIPDKPVKELVFRTVPEGISCWMIGGAAIGKLRNPRNFTKVVIRQNEDWRPLHNIKLAEKGSVLDFSFLLDSPAGKYGFVKGNGEHFEFEKRPGKRIRFVGGNLCAGANRMRKEQTDRLVEVVSRLGYNIVRLHHYDSEIVKNGTPPGTVEFDPVSLDRMDYLISKLIGKGIYLSIDLYTSRKTVVEGYPLSSKQFKIMTYLDNSGEGIRDWMNFSEKILTHVNPYTGRALKDEPALVSICMVNECLPNHSSIDCLPAPFKKKWMDAYEKWLAGQNEIAKKVKSQQNWYRFCTERTLPSNAFKMAFLRKLGVKQLLTDLNMSNYLAVLLQRKNLDFVDNHFYFHHPSATRVPIFMKQEQLADAPYCATLGGSFISRRAGSPYSITEWDFGNPSPNAVEGAAAIGAYAALQDWGMLVRFAITHWDRRVDIEELPITFWDILCDPQRLLSERMNACFFQREDVKTADESVLFRLPENYLEKPDYTLWAPKFPARVGMMMKTGTLIGNDPIPKSARGILEMRYGCGKSPLPSMVVEGRSAKDLYQEAFRKKNYSRRTLRCQERDDAKHHRRD